MTQALTDDDKFVVSRNRETRLPWENSTLLVGEGLETVAELKEHHDGTLILFGSGVLVRSLMAHDLVDEFLLMVHPIILGKGYLLFDANVATSRLSLSNQAATDTGVAILTYRTSAE